MEHSPAEATERPQFIEVRAAASPAAPLSVTPGIAQCVLELEDAGDDVRFAHNPWTTGEIAMTSDGTPWRPLVHILDISQAVEEVLRAPAEAVSGEIFNVGDDAQNYRVREVAEIVAADFPGCELTFGTGGSKRALAGRGCDAGVDPRR